MKVYVLTDCQWHEGSSIEGVYATLQDAQDALEGLAQRYESVFPGCTLPREEYRVMSYDSVRTWTVSYGSTGILEIEEREVEGGQPSQAG